MKYLYLFFLVIFTHIYLSAMENIGSLQKNKKPLAYKQSSLTIHTSNKVLLVPQAITEMLRTSMNIAPDQHSVLLNCDELVLEKLLVFMDKHSKPFNSFFTSEDQGKRYYQLLTQVDITQARELADLKVGKILKLLHLPDLSLLFYLAWTRKSDNFFDQLMAPNQRDLLPLIEEHIRYDNPSLEKVYQFIVSRMNLSVITSESNLKSQYTLSTNAASNKEIIIENTATQKKQILKIPDGFPCIYNFSFNGKYFAHVLHNHTIQIWDMQTGQCIQTLKGHAHFISHVNFTPDNNYLFSRSEDDVIKMWDLTRGLCVKSFDGRYYLICWNTIFDTLDTSMIDTLAEYLFSTAKLHELPLLQGLATAINDDGTIDINKGYQLTREEVKIFPHLGGNGYFGDSLKDILIELVCLHPQTKKSKTLKKKKHKRPII